MKQTMWTSLHDARLQTHFDLVNSTNSLKQYLEKDIIVVLFSGEHISGKLAKVGWDYICIFVSKNATEYTRIDFVREGREEYVISSIRLCSADTLIYDHIDPKSHPFIPPAIQAHIDRIIS